MLSRGGNLFCVSSNVDHANLPVPKLRKEHAPFTIYGYETGIGISGGDRKLYELFCLRVKPVDIVSIHVREPNVASLAIDSCSVGSCTDCGRMIQLDLIRLPVQFSQLVAVKVTEPDVVLRIEGHTSNANHSRCFVCF